MKINLNRKKSSIAPNKNLFKKIISVSISVCIIVISFVVMTKSTEAARQTISVVRVRSNGISADTVLTEKDIETYALIKKEYTSDMILAEEKDKVIGKSTLYYLRKNSIIYNDQITDERAVKNEWIYDLGEDMEVLTLPYNYLEVGGDILMPGDRVRIRISFESTNAQGYDDGLTYTYGNKEYKTVTLFDDIVIVDMLNANSHSIYEVYKEVGNLSEDKKAEVMKSSGFLKSIQPKALVLSANKGQVENYSKYKKLGPQSLLITILSRNENSVILDQLPTVQKEVESWISQPKN